MISKCDTQMREPIIYLDLDGVMVDFVGASVQLLCPVGWEHIMKTWPKGEFDVWTVLGVSVDKFWAEIDREGMEFWRSLKPYPWAMELYNRLNELGKVVILTSPARSANSALGKILWMQDFFMEGMSFRDYMLVPSDLKYQLAAPGRILVDDAERNVRAFDQMGGQAVMVPQPWNYAEEPAAGEMAEYLAVNVCKLLSGNKQAQGD